MSTPRVTRTPKVAPAERQETLQQVAQRASAAAPVIGGLRAILEDQAIAIAAYRRTLINEGIPTDMADTFVRDQHESILAIDAEADGDEDNEPDGDPEDEAETA